MDTKLPSIEILVATMHRVSMEFLWDMLKYNNHTDFKILIVNQTTPDKLLISEFEYIKVINSFEFGVAKSRNLAITNATADVCLMADDDIIYQPHLKTMIAEAYLKYPNAAMISFEAIDEEGLMYTNYFPAGHHTKKSLKKIYTWVISFRRVLFLKNTVFYNLHFGFGAAFNGEEEYVFLRNAFDQGLKMIHVSETIVQHPNENSGKLMGSDHALVARSAVAYRFYGNFSYLWLVKYVFFIYRHNYITFNQIPFKYKMGLIGISKYKTLSKLGEINKIYDL
ncbi:glycosyltransferase family 2 protein [Gelidibacter salicanalis]|uniref:Glycosyltransferase family 2 protein n=1 Tax=Gelidibacter salicanalis TaxID=291193 RepID=A0A934NH52_9FLAO|nr:glycosyltransferase family A protein [Gelidibacter salicanalis]MBJ7879253.1 glycosyltransferase family 2 protein [Gelidibacter salicanalis]